MSVIVHGIFRIILFAFHCDPCTVEAVGSSPQLYQLRVIQALAPHVVLQILVVIIHAGIDDGHHLLGGIHLRCRGIAAAGIPAVHTQTVGRILAPLQIGVIFAFCL